MPYDIATLPSVGTLIVAPEPLSARLNRIELAERLTLAQALVLACNQGGLALSDVRRARVSIDGRSVEVREAFDQLLPAGATIVVAAAPGDPISATIAFITSVATWVGAAVGGLATAALGGASSAFALSVGGAISNALFSLITTSAASLGLGVLERLLLPKPDRLANANSSYALQDQTNTLRPYGRMPMVTGPMRVAFDVAARPYTRIVGNDQYLICIFGVHFGPCGVEDLKIGETLVTSAEPGDVELEYFLTPGPRVSALYPGDPNQENFNDELELGTNSGPVAGNWGDYEVHTSAEDATRLELDFNLPGGLSYTRDDGDNTSQAILLQLEYSVAGAGIWLNAPFSGFKDRHGNTLPNGVVSIIDRTQDAIRKTFGWDVAANQYDIRARIKIAFEDSEHSNHKIFWTAIRSIQQGAPILDEVASFIVLKVKASDDFSGSLPTFSGKVTPFTPNWDPAANSGEGGWTGGHDVYDEETWGPCDNAAEFLAYALCSYPAARPLDIDQLDISFGDHAALIEEKDWKGSLLLQQDMSQKALMSALGSVGRFDTYWQGASLVCVGITAKPIPTDVFGNRNTQNYSFQRAFPPPVHAFRCEFYNRDEDDRPDELVVYADGYGKVAGEGVLAATLIEARKLDFSTTKGRVYREMRRELAKRFLQVESHEWDSGNDARFVRLGTRVSLRHPAVEIGLADARVIHRIFNGLGLVTGLRLDGYVQMEADVDYAIEGRRADGKVVCPLTTVEGRSRIVQLATPAALDNAPLGGDFVVFGVEGQVTDDVEIADALPTERGAHLKATRYIEEDLEAAETGEIPEFEPTITPLPRAPVPIILQAVGSPAGVVVSFAVHPRAGARLKNISARWRVTSILEEEAVGLVDNEWHTLPLMDPSVREVRTPAIEGAANMAFGDQPLQVDVDIRSIITSGDVSAWAHAVGIPMVEGAPVAPREDAWTAVGASLESETGAKLPAIVVEGACDNAAAEAILIDYRLPEDEEWTHHGPVSPLKTRIEIKGLAPLTAYDVAVSYRVLGVEGAKLIFEGVVSGEMIASGVVGIDIPATVTRITDLLAYVDAQAEAIVTLANRLAEMGFDLFDRTMYSGRQVTYTTDNHAKLFELLGVRAPGGAAFILNTADVWVSPDGTSLADVAAGASLTTLLGASNVGGTAFQLNMATVEVGPGYSFASYISDTSATLGDLTSDVQTWIDVRAGISAAWGLKVNSNGHFASALFFADETESDIIFAADTFAISNNLTGATSYPFILTGGVLYLQNIVVDGALIEDLTVGTLKFTDGSVITPKIAANAVNNVHTAFTQSSITSSSTSSFTVLQTLTVTVEEASSVVLIQAFANPNSANFGGSHQPDAYLFRDSTELQHMNHRGDVDILFIYPDTPGAGTFTYELRTKNATVAAAGAWINRSVTTQEIKR